MGALPEQHQEKLVSTARTLARVLLDVLPDPAWVKDTAGRYIAVNTAFRKVLQPLAQRNGEAIGCTDFDLHARDYAERRLSDHAADFGRLAGLAERRMTGGALSETDEHYLAECEQRDALFPESDWSALQGERLGSGRASG